MMHSEHNKRDCVANLLGKQQANKNANVRAPAQVERFVFEELRRCLERRLERINRLPDNVENNIEADQQKNNAKQLLIGHGDLAELVILEDAPDAEILGGEAGKHK